MRRKLRDNVLVCVLFETRYLCQPSHPPIGHLSSIVVVWIPQLGQAV
jgi:hypothetical protein